MPASPAVRITIHDELPGALVAPIAAGLEIFNRGAAALDDVRPLSCVARDGETVVAGAIGRSWGLCCELQQLWVDPPRRRDGLGRELLEAFEAAARERGCRTLYLETFSFQAPDFYQACGYREHARIEGFAPGVVKYLMIRDLSDRPD